MKLESLLRSWWI